MDLGIRDKVALVLGAGGGLGSAIALGLAREGVRVAVAGRRMENVSTTVEQIVSAGGTAMGLAWDLADLDAIETQIARVEKTFGPVSILVNNTGGPPPTPAAGQSPELWEKHFRAMVMSVIAITDRVLPSMRLAKWGRIITSTSSGVVAPIPNLAISNALRQTLVGWSKTLATEVGREGITANIVLPGRIATQRIGFLDQKKAERENRTVEDVAAQSLAAIPVGRYGSPEEYADVVAFLASERASYVTGSIVRVDGGLISSI